MSKVPEKGQEQKMTEPILDNVVYDYNIDDEATLQKLHARRRFHVKSKMGPKVMDPKTLAAAKRFYSKQDPVVLDNDEIVSSIY